MLNYDDRMKEAFDRLTPAEQKKVLEETEKVAYKSYGYYLDKEDDDSTENIVKPLVDALFDVIAYIIDKKRNGGK